MSSINNDEFLKNFSCDLKKHQCEQNLKEQKLREQGHTCIIISQTYPSQIRWCRQETCIEKQ